MKAKFNDFINENKNCSGFKDNQTAEDLFNIIAKDSNIIKMIQYSEFGKPALEACVIEIESYYDNLVKPDINLEDKFTRQAIGRMAKTILSVYGYEVGIQKDISRSMNTKYFTSATCYCKSEESCFSQMIIIDDIMELKKGTEVLTNLHLEYNISFKYDDTNDVTQVSINNRAFKLNTKYQYRSQGNAHLIFWSENGAWCAQSFDGCKGDMYVRNNNIIDYLVNVLNAKSQIDDDYFNPPREEEIYKYLSEFSTKG